MELTLRAQSLRCTVELAIERVQQVFECDTFDPQTSTRAFHLEMSDYGTNLILPSLAERMRVIAPSVRIMVRRRSATFAESRLGVPTPDVVLTCQTGDLPGFYRQRLFTDRDVCVVRRGHPLVGKKLTMEGFLKTLQVGIETTEHTEGLIDSALRKVRKERRVIMSVPQYIDALSLIAHSNLMGVIPERLVRVYARALGLSVLQLPLNVGTFDEYLLHPAQAHSDEGSRWIRSLIASLDKIA